MYKSASAYHDLIFYFDDYGNKYVANGGHLSWRINNPGLVNSRSRFAKKHGAIGACGRFAIFAHPEQGHKALADRLRSKKHGNSTLDALAKHYRGENDPKDAESKLASYSGLALSRKVSSLSAQEFERLLHAIEKLCGFVAIGNESLVLLPKITAIIENGKGKEDSYLVGTHIVLSKLEAIEWILSHRLDAVIVQEGNGMRQVRSRTSSAIGTLWLPKKPLPLVKGKIETIARVVGEQKPGQCIWGYINGLFNSKDEALESTKLISAAAGGQAVFSMPNDTALLGVKNLIDCFALKLTFDTPIIKWGTQFFRYLLRLSEQDSLHPPVIVFAHSLGAMISDHVLDLLTNSERQKIRVFTFGGGCFIPPNKSHPDSHNYASASDPICRVSSPNLQILALERYQGQKDGLNQDQLIQRLAMKDAMLYIDSTDPKVLEAFLQQRKKHYLDEFARISNVTVLDPDPGSLWKHRFSSHCYQATILSIINKYTQATYKNNC